LFFNTACGKLFSDSQKPIGSEDIVAELIIKAAVLFVLICQGLYVRNIILVRIDTLSNELVKIVRLSERQPIFKKVRNLEFTYYAVMLVIVLLFGYLCYMLLFWINFKSIP